MGRPFPATEISKANVQIAANIFGPPQVKVKVESYRAETDLTGVISL